MALYPKLSDPAEWEPTRPNQTLRWPVQDLPHLQRRDVGLCPDTDRDSLHHLLQHDAQAINCDLDDDEGVYVRYRLDGSLFNLWRLQAHTKTQDRLIQNLLFADDASLVAHTEQALQRVTSCFADTSRLFGLDVSLKKTEVLKQPAPREEYRPPHINIGDTELKTTQQFTHLMPRSTRK